VCFDQIWKVGIVGVKLRAASLSIRVLIFRSRVIVMRVENVCMINGNKSYCAISMMEE
jgi:hypothetical protein